MFQPTHLLGKAVCLAAIAILSACATTPRSHVDPETDLAAITAFNEEYLRAINAGDSAALSELTDADHIMIVPNRTPIAGKAANDAANARGFKEFKIEERWAPLETVVDHDLAYQRGTFTVVATPKAGGAARTTRGNFLRIYRRQSDGSWRMTRDMFSSGQSSAGQ